MGMVGWGPSIGQYLGTYAKWYRNTGDKRLRQKALEIFHGWCECVEKNEDLLDCGTYLWEKFLGGFLDMYEYMGLESLPARPNTWLTLERTWKDGDEIRLSLPYSLRFVPVDAQHPNAVALLYGPLVLCCDEMTVLVGDQAHPETWIQPIPGEENTFRTLPGHSGVYPQICRTFRPYYTVGLMSWYYMYNRIYPDMETLDRVHQGT